MIPVTLTADQQRALDAIVGARSRSGRFLLSGHAGSGKTFLMQQVARAFKAKGLRVVMTAPTHKAVAVLAAKLRQADLDDILCLTIHSLLSLHGKPDADKMTFVRKKNAPPVEADVVVIDECSMLGEDLMRHIRLHLPRAFVLFVGDPAQLPPIDEVASQSFDTKARAHLDTIVRQGAGNPVLEAAHAIRASQGGPMDWSWCRTARAGSQGVFQPGRNVDAWMRKAFTSPDFDADPDRFRYLAYTNARVAQVNKMVRHWRYGADLPTPFMPGERALFRAPVMKDEHVAFATNEEADVLEIEASVFRYDFEPVGHVDGWTAELPSWKLMLRRGDDTVIPVHMPAQDRALQRIVDRIKDEASACRERWQHLHDFQSSIAKLQSIYALTTHTAQGSTFGTAFLDLPDIRRRERDNVLETQQMLYVGVTRPSQSLVLVGA